MKRAFMAICHILLYHTDCAIWNRGRIDINYVVNLEKCLFFEQSIALAI